MSEAQKPSPRFDSLLSPLELPIPEIQSWYLPANLKNWDSKRIESDTRFIEKNGKQIYNTVDTFYTDGDKNTIILHRNDDTDNRLASIQSVHYDSNESLLNIWPATTNPDMQNQNFHFHKRLVTASATNKEKSRHISIIEQIVWPENKLYGFDFAAAAWADVVFKKNTTSIHYEIPKGLQPNSHDVWIVKGNVNENNCEEIVISDGITGQVQTVITYSRVDDGRIIPTIDDYTFDDRLQVPGQLVSDLNSILRETFQGADINLNLPVSHQARAISQQAMRYIQNP